MDFDIIVVGGGHAGLEAALAASRLGYRSQLISQSLDCIAKMSCNPAVGGLSKGNIVREIDALGGEMAKLIDATMIQFRVLNRSRGPAVQAPRAQADKTAYSTLAKHVLERESNLSIFQDTVVDFLLSKNGREIAGVLTERGRKFSAKRVILSTGTFMEAVIYIGQFTCSSGRLGEPAARGLGTNLRKLGFSVGRLKTGTPARVARSSIDFSKMAEQRGEEEILPFSFSHDGIQRPSVSCYMTYSTEETHQIIRDNMEYSPLYSGKIEGVGPRYCPSIEDKVMRFPERDRHQIFVEPEGLNTEEMYLNGISSSLPEEVQERFLRTVPGLEQVEIMRPGYAVEYDFMDPTQLYPSLESKRIAGLYIVGQTNGTSGYEEAGCQGLIAGINAALSLSGEGPLILTRAEAYTGVLIDDLVTLGTNEPYRMFTSRAEYRLSLRHDSADRRLLEKAYRIGLQSEEAMERFQEKIRGIDAVKELLRQRNLAASDLESLDENTRQILHKHIGDSFYHILKDPTFNIELLSQIEKSLSEKEKKLLRDVELDVKYEGYIAKQERQVNRYLKMENVKIPPDFDYDRINGISNESKEKLKLIRPLSVGQASRISGVRNADITVLLFLLGKAGRARSGSKG